MRLKANIPSFFCAVILITISLSGCTQPAKFDTAVIGFYNLENLFDTINQPHVQDEEFTPDSKKRYTSVIYNDKLNKLSKIISKIGADGSPDGLVLLGVAEAENKDVLKDLSKTSALAKRNYQIAHVDGPDERGIDVGLLYNPKYFKPGKIQSLHVPTEKMDTTSGFTRDILYVSGDLLDDRLHIFVNHWPSRRGGEESSRPYRKLAAAICRKAIDSLVRIDPQTKILVLGDFNDNPDDESVSNVLHAERERLAVNKGGLYNPWLKLYNEGIGSLKYQDQWYLFDQIMVSSALLDEDQEGFFFKDAEIFKEDFMIQKTGKYQGYPKRTYSWDTYIGGYSDHLPVYVILLRKKETSE